MTDPSSPQSLVERRLSTLLESRAWPLNAVARWAWDIAIGSDFFLAKRL